MGNIYYIELILSNTKPYRYINNTSDYTLKGLDKGFALVGATIIRSNRWRHPMKIPFLLCCLPSKGFFALSSKLLHPRIFP